MGKILTGGMIFILKYVSYLFRKIFSGGVLDFFW